MRPLRIAILAPLALLFAACATRPDPSRYVSLGSHNGYYLIEAGSPLQEKLGYGLAPVSDTADPLHRGYGSDVIAFYFNRARVLAAPPAYIIQMRPDPWCLARLSHLVQGASTQAMVERMFRSQNQRLIQPDGGLLLYHREDVYNALEQMTGPGNR
jgi:hypothetical protein